MNIKTHLLIVALILASLAVGCGRDAIKWSYASDDILNMAPSKWDDAEAEVLLAEDRWVIATKDDWYTQRHEHRVIRLLSERGIDRWASLRIVYPESGSLRDFKARVIQPDGEILDLDEEDLIRDVDGDTAVAKLRFPQVKVGSIIEYGHTIEWDSIQTYTANLIGTSVPVRRYRLEMWVSKELKAKIHVYNTDEATQRADVGNFWRYTWAVDAIPPRESEWADPHFTLAEPWYIYQVKRGDFGRWTRDYFKNWAYETRPTSRWLFTEQPFLEGFEDTWDPAGCTGTSCVESALASVHEAIKLTEVGDLDARSLTTVVEDGWGSSTEKALLLASRLQRAGLTVNYGIANRARRRLYDRKVPNMQWIDYLIVQVPKQEGIAEDIWLDPGCEYCAVGEIPRWIDDTNVMRLRMKGSKFKAKMTKASGRVKLPGEQMWVRQLLLDSDGTLTVETTERRTRQEAMGRLMAERDFLERDQVWVDQLKQRLQRYHPDMLLIEAPQPIYDRNAGVYERTYLAKVPQYAIVDAETMLVPLDLLHSALRLPEERERDLVLDSEHREDVVTIVPPDGWEVVEASLPTAGQWAHEAVASTLTATRDPETGRAILTQTIDFKRGHYDAEHYPAIRDVVMSSEVLGKRAVMLRKIPTVAPEPAVGVELPAVADVPTEPIPLEPRADE